LNHESSRFLIQ
jgi:hypothetical protein